jgi:D-inositol-3-phosphate glycosyltransferase
LSAIFANARDHTVVIPHGEYGGLARTGGTPDRDGARAALEIAANAPVTLMFGQLRADKGLDQILAALTRVPSLQLLVAGKDLGALSAARSQLQSPELVGRVIVREGFLDMREAAQLFAATDTVVLPYKLASQSGVLLLAYGFRRPVIVYPVGGLVEAVIDGETGWICRRSDPDALADALTASIVAGWPECQRRGEAGARLADERFSWPVIARSTIDVYDKVLTEKSHLRRSPS